MRTAAARPVMALVTGIAEYHVRVLAGMAEALDTRNTPLLVIVNEPFGSESTPTIVLELIHRRIPRGVVALADTAQFHRPELPEALRRAQMPTVTLGAKAPGAPRVVGDNVEGMRQLMAHLMDECGARRLGLVRGTPGHIDSEERERVFRAELTARGVPVDEDLLVTGMFRPNTAFAQVRDLLERRTDVQGLVALNDTSAFGALAAINHLGLRVPDDLLLSGFDNTDGSRLSWPPLTTVDQNLEEQGRRVVEGVLRLARGGQLPGTGVVPSRLVVRASTSSTRGAALASANPDRLAAMPGVTMIDGVPMVALPELADQLGELGATTRALQERVAIQDAALNLSWTTSNCRTMGEVITALDPCLSRLGIPRCFLVIDHLAPAGQRGSIEHPSRLVLSYRGGRSEPVGDEVFARHELLPPRLRAELDHGVLLLQPLSTAGKERGFLLYEPVTQAYLTTEALRIDLPRTIEMVLRSQEMADHAAMLEGLVTQRTRELEQANAELQSFVMRDGLTGIPNRLAFQHQLEDVTASAGSGPGADAVDVVGVGTDVGATDVAVMMIDVDMFKAFNDRYGHLAGDEALKSVAACLTRAMRSSRDLACRYGGEEFAVVLRGARERGALVVAKRFQRLLAQTAIRHEASPVAPIVTASVGIAARRVGPDVTPTNLVEMADQALYQAKLEGRNRIVVAGRRQDVPRRAG